MKIIGITGKSGSGKSTLAARLSKQWKARNINIDKIGHQAINDQHIAQTLIKVLGKEIVGDMQKIDRKKLGNMVFSDQRKMKQLTDITWGYMQEALNKMIEGKEEWIILDWALLPISEFWETCDIKIWMQADDDERKNQVKQRDKISDEYFQKRDANSLNYELYQFDYIFRNDYQINTIDNIIKTIKLE